MKVKKQRRHRKAVRFFTACYGFRQPFKILCDGTFIYHCAAHKITPPDKALSNILAAPVKLFTTRCVLQEMRKLGKSYSESFEAARKLPIARCEHDNNSNGEICISDVVGGNNSEHFFVATQHVDLRRKLQEIPGVPVIYGLRSALFLEQPSATQRQFVKTSEEERLHMTTLELKMLKKRTVDIVAGKELNNFSEENEESGEDKFESSDVKKVQYGSRGIGLKDKPQFKRKKAKGPNPLSCLKKKKHKNVKPAPEKDKKDTDGTLKSSSRKRKRTRKSKVASSSGDS